MLILKPFIIVFKIIINDLVECKLISKRLKKIAS